MPRASLALLFASACLLGGCSSTSSSKLFTSEQTSHWTGPVFVSQSQLPAGVLFKVVGSVKANARVGYDSAAELYPLLASEARKLGANAVIGVTGSRRVTAFSWAAPHVNGTAVRVEDPEKLKGLAGSYH